MVGLELLKFFLIIVGAGTLAALTDFVFTGGWVQKRFTDPAIWRKDHGGKAAFLASLLPFFTCAIFAFTANQLAIRSVHASIKLALAMWAIGPLPLILTNAAFLKLRWAYATNYAIAWLVKLMIIAVLVGRLLR
jgi:hypothetical protein